MVPVVGPIPPIVVGPLTNVQPFTYRDGETYASMLYRLRAYVIALGEMVNTSLDQTIAAVDAAIAANQIWTQSEIQKMIEYVNEQVALIIDDSIEVQDPVVAGIFNDPASQTRVKTDTLYAAKSIEATVTENTTDITALETLTNTGRLSESALDAEYQAKDTVYDPAVAALIDSNISATIESLRARFSKVDEISLGDPMQQGAADISRTIALTGDSLMYGQDTTATGTNPPVNGATHTRSSNPPTDAFRSQGVFTSTSAVVIVNQAYPGDRTTEALTRWVNGSSGDAEFFWLGTNDAMAYGPGTPLSDAQSMANIAKLAKRARDRGAPFVVIGGAPVSNQRNSFKIFASSESLRTVAARYGAIYVDAGEILNDVDEANGLYWTDGVHWSPQAYSLIGARLAGLLGPKGVNAPKVSPGRKFTWMDNVHTGGSIVAAGAPSVNGSIIRAAEGSAGAVTIPFWAIEPVVPLVKFRTTTAAVVGVYSNLHVNRQPLRATIPATNEVLAVVGPPVTSPGPAATTIFSESGTVDIISVEYLPVDRIAGKYRYDMITKHFAPIGGLNARADVNADAALFWDSGVALRTGATQATVVKPRFLFDLRIGGHLSGVFLAASIDLGKFQMVDNGYMVRRFGTNFRMSKIVDGSATDTTVTYTYPASGIAATTLELYCDGNNILVYADQTLVHTFTDNTWRYFIPGIVAGSNTNGYAAGSMSIARI